MKSDIANLKLASAAAPTVAAFMNAASPGVIALFQPNDYYPTQDAYLEALAEALRGEYEAIVSSGILLQIDAPDLAMGRHTMYRDRTLEQFDVLAARHIEVLNHALRNVPAERVRMHVCWGNYEGPHHHDVPMERLLPIVMKAKPQGLLFEAANPRHAHEWVVFQKGRVPQDKVLIPGILATTTNYIEHPELVAERIQRFADVKLAVTGSSPAPTAASAPLPASSAGRARHRLPEACLAGGGRPDRIPAALGLAPRYAGNAAVMSPRRTRTAAVAATAAASPPFRFYDNRQKYLAFVTACNDKAGRCAPRGA